MFDTKDVSAVVCTLNSIASIESCLSSLASSGVGEVIVVDGGSTDGTLNVAHAYADLVLNDPGQGLSIARNTGIRESRCDLILNMGSDNTITRAELQKMIGWLERTDSHGVSSQTVVEGSSYIARGMNAWRAGRFRIGPAKVIGTPTLLRRILLEQEPFDEARRFSDDSELCERWRRVFGAHFEISDAYVGEIGKASWSQVVARCRLYGISDFEIYRFGRASGWPFTRRLLSWLHPFKSNFILPLTRNSPGTALLASPFLLAFTFFRYLNWIKSTWHRGHL
jgi:glycosyltransferase involved in cell wall biosynthesis